MSRQSRLRRWLHPHSGLLVGTSESEAGGAESAHFLRLKREGERLGEAFSLPLRLTREGERLGDAISLPLRLKRDGDLLSGDDIRRRLGQVSSMAILL